MSCASAKSQLLSKKKRDYSILRFVVLEGCVFSYFVRRVLSLIPVCFGVLTIVCFLIHLVPGDPVDQILGDFATEQEKLELRADLGLDRPVHRQLFDYAGGVLTGNLGTSLLFQRPVLELISERYLATVQLALVAMLLAAFLGIPLGVMGALNRGTSKDLVCMSFSLLGVHTNFWLGPM